MNFFTQNPFQSPLAQSLLYNQHLLYPNLNAYTPSLYQAPQPQVQYREEIVIDDDEDDSEIIIMEPVKKAKVEQQASLSNNRTYNAYESLMAPKLNVQNYQNYQPVFNQLLENLTARANLNILEQRARLLSFQNATLPDLTGLKNFNLTPSYAYNMAQAKASEVIELESEDECSTGASSNGFEQSQMTPTDNSLSFSIKKLQENVKANEPVEATIKQEGAGLSPITTTENIVEKSEEELPKKDAKIKTASKASSPAQEKKAKKSLTNNKKRFLLDDVASQKEEIVKKAEPEVKIAEETVSVKTCDGVECQLADIPPLMRRVEGQVKRRTLKPVWNPAKLSTEVLESYMQKISKVLNQSVTHEDKVIKQLEKFNMNVQELLNEIEKNKAFFRNHLRADTRVLRSKTPLF